MLLLSLLLPPLIISLPQSISKLSHLPSGIKSAVRHFRGSPTTPGDSASPVEGIPDLHPDPSDETIIPEPLKPIYQPLLYTGRDAWRAFLEDPVGSWEKGDRDHVWFFWFSGVDVHQGGEIVAPLIEETEWPAVAGDENGEFELRRRKLEVGMFHGSHNDEVYRDTAIEIAKQQQQTEWEQEKQARLSASSASKNPEPTSVDQIIFSSDTPNVIPSSYAHFAFVNCNDEEEKSLCYRFLAIEEHRPILYAVVRNTTIIEPEPVSKSNAEPGVAPLVPEFVHMGANDPRLTKQDSEGSTINIEIEEKDISEDPVVEEVIETELPSPPQPTVIYKLLLRKVPLKENLTTTDLHNFYEFKRWEKLPVWDDPLNPADGLVGTALEGKAGEFIGIGYEYWYRTPKWVLGMTLGLLLRWITVTIIDRSQQKREKKKASKREKKAAESASALAEVARTPLKTQAILPEVPEVAEIPVETQVPEEAEVVEHAELARAEEVGSIAEILGQRTKAKENNPVVETNGDEPAIETIQDQPAVQTNGDIIESIEDTPIVHMNEDSPVIPITEDTPVHNTEDKPVIHNNEDEPIKNNEDTPPPHDNVIHDNEDKPVIQNHEDKPTLQDNEGKPVIHDSEDEYEDEEEDGDEEEDVDEEEDEDEDESAVQTDESRPILGNVDKPVVINEDEPAVTNDNPVDIYEDRPVIDNEDKPVVEPNENRPVAHTNGDNLAASINEDGWPVDLIGNESIILAKNERPAAEVEEQSEIKAEGGETDTEVNEEEAAVDDKEEKPVVETSEVKALTHTPEVKPEVGMGAISPEHQTPLREDKTSTEGL